MPERIDFWGIPHTWGPPELFVYGLMGLAAVVFLARFYLSARLWWQAGRPEKRWDKLHLRIWRLIQYAILQFKVLRQRFPGLMHVALAWGFFVFFLGTAFATIDSHFVKILTGNSYLIYKLSLDLFTLLFLIGAVMAVYRRYSQKPDRLTLRSGFTWSLILIILIVLGGLVAESLRLAVEQPAWGWWTPVGWILAQLWIVTGASETALTNLRTGVWTFHLLSAALMTVAIPGSTLAHLVSSPLNIFFSNIDRPKGKLAPLGESKDGDPIYVSSLKDLTWKQLLDGDACTECGRCQDACPAYASGTPLSPKELILSLRDALHQDGRSILGGNGETPLLVGERIDDIVLWSCTTCGACVEECPVMIEHLDTIVDMRRYLVIEGRVDAELQDALANLGRYGNSFGKSPRMRARWARRLDPKIKDARKEPVEYLWFVGDYASFSSTLTEATKKTAAVFNQAGLNFGILYDGENHSGNDVRRVGEEGLFEMLVEKNYEALSKTEYGTIVTTDPHTYNSLKNEYPANGNGNKPVLHYSELLDDLITSGKLKFGKTLDHKVTFHDPCYLARYNGIHDAPRRVIEATGCQIVEMPRNRENTFCCGAGGGRIWMEEIPDISERPAENRMQEAANLPGVTTFIVACPKDLVMFQDAVKTSGLEEKIIVKDLIDLVEEALDFTPAEVTKEAAEEKQI